MPLQTLYRACFFYYDSLDWRKKNKLNIFCSTTVSSKEEAIKYLDDNVYKMYAKLLTKFVGKAFTVKNLGDHYYLIESGNIVGFTALGDITPVYKIHPGYYKYRHFNVYKYSDKLIVKDFVGNLLGTIEFTNDIKDQAFNEAFDLVDKYANDPKYLKDHDFNGFMKRKKKARFIYE